MTTEIVEPAGKRKWYEIWWDVWGNPGIISFQALLNEANHSSNRGFIWLGVATVMATLIDSLCAVLLAGDFRTIISQFTIKFYLTYLCGFLLTPVFSILGLAMVTLIFHIISKLFGGTGKWDELAFSFSAVVAPYTLFAGAMAVLYLMFPNVLIMKFVPLVVSVVMGFYMLILYVNAIRAAEKIGTGRAIGTLVTPVILLGVCFLIVFLGLLPSTGTGN